MFKRTNGKGDTLYKYHKCVIGIDQSYKRTGVSIAVDGVLKKVTSIDFKAVKTKTAKRLLLQETLRKAITSCMGKHRTEDIVVVCERLRTITAGTDIRPGVIKPGAAMIAYIVDTGAEFGVETWSADTRAWKASVLGSSRPVFDPIAGVKDPQKFGAVRKVIELGFEKSITRSRNNGAFKCYDDDAAESACIALYAFEKRNTLKQEY